MNIDFLNQDTLTEDDPLYSLLQQPTNEQKRRKKEIEEEEKRELLRAKSLQEEVTKNQKRYTDFLDKQTQREKDLRIVQGLEPDATGKLHNLKTRKDDLYKESIKEHYGFTPDSKKKKVLAGILEGVTGMASGMLFPLGMAGYGQSRAKANIGARQNMQDEFTRLLGTERLESQNFKDQSQAAQRNISDLLKAEVGMSGQNVQKEIADKKAALQKELTSQTIASKEKINATKVAFDEEKLAAQKLVDEAKIGNLEADTALKEFKKKIAEEMGIDPAQITNANLPVILAKRGDKAFTDEVLGIAGRLNKEKQKPVKPHLKTTKSWKIDPTTGEVIGEDLQVHYVPAFPGGGDGTTASQAETTKIGSAVKAPLKEKQGPVLTKHQYGTGINDETYANVEPEAILADIKKGPIKEYTIPDAKKKYHEMTVTEGIRRTNDLNMRSTDIASNVAKGLADGSLAKFRNFGKQTGIMQTVRGMMGDISTAEAGIQQKEVINIMEHLRQRFGTRPAFETLSKVADTMDKDTDNAESYARRQFNMHLLVQGMNEMVKDPRIEQLIRRANENQGKDRAHNKTFAEALEEEINYAMDYNKNKRGPGYYVPSFKGALDRLVRKKISYKEYKKGQMGPQE